MSMLLDVQHVTMRFGGVEALSDVSFHVEEGELLSLIGPNGAGKTTLLRAIIGMITPHQRAVIRLRGRDITPLPTHRRARLGLVMTNQIVRPFLTMTLRDNVALAAGSRHFTSMIAAMTSFSRKQEYKKAYALLQMLGIGHLADQPVVGQPLGVLKRLEVAKGLALNPRVLLLDEPLAGLNHVEAAQLADLVVAINREKVTVVMIEHNLGEVLRISQRMVVLDNGIKLAEGDPQEVMGRPEVRAAYVGGET
ncbi:MAG: ABC transporter ATP-binding protein [Deltaproteobacteria bacterium]|nr:MAG: ABC transporter ATP-binding protein [Deltaproteobacteria bacterium]